MTATPTTDDEQWWVYLNAHLSTFFPYMEKWIGVTDTYTWALLLIPPVMHLHRGDTTVLLQAAYDRLPESPAIRGPEFTALCNLLDGGYKQTRN